MPGPAPHRHIPGPCDERLRAIHAAPAPLPAPPRFALAIAQAGERVLLVRNRARGVWELPGGWIDPGETPLHCACREVAEESGQTLVDPAPCAGIELHVPGPRGGEPGTRLGVLFHGRIDTPLPFAPTAEIEAMGYWTPDALPAGLAAIDAALLAWWFDPARAHTRERTIPATA